ncbi:MAG TPA: hypothetical protein VFJ72_00895 [Rubrobacteraceae bacterium]|nr:hypothetical protein [Rubrobacteraceae bacterium]
MSFPDSQPEASAHSSAHSFVTDGVRAAGALEEACRRSLEETQSLHLEVVRDLAADLRRQLDALSGMVEERAEPRVDAALACADLATLAACNVIQMPPAEARTVANAVHIAAGAAHSLSGTAENISKDEAEYLARDARGARWKADLASRQADEFLSSRRS